SRRPHRRPQRPAPDRLSRRRRHHDQGGDPMHAVAVDEAFPLQRRHRLSRAWWCAAVGSYALLAFDFFGHIIHPGDAPLGVWVMFLNYVGGVTLMIPILLFSDDPPTFFYVGHTVGWLDSWNWWWTFIFLITTPVYFWVAWYRIRHASPGLRRSIVPFFTVVALA